MTQTKKNISRTWERKREREYYRKKNEEKSDDERADIIYAKCFVVGRREFIGGVLHFLISQLFPHHETIEACVSAYLPPRYHIIPVE